MNKDIDIKASGPENDKAGSTDELSAFITPDNLDDAVFAGHKIKSFELNSIDSEYIGQAIDQFDTSIMDCIYTITQYGKANAFSVEQVAKILTGNANGPYSQELLDKITQSIDKLRAVRISLNLEADETSKTADDEYEAVSFKDNLLSADKMVLRQSENNEELTAYKLIKQMPLYRYAEMNNEIKTVPSGHIAATQKKHLKNEE